MGTPSQQPHPNPQRSIYIVSSRHDIDQVFATAEDAEWFAIEHPGAWVSRHYVRGSVDEAVIIFDRRVVVSHGATVIDETKVVRRFIDDPHDRPVTVDVEWFHDATNCEWHIVGFGIDKDALDAQVEDAIHRVRELGQASASEGARRRSPTQKCRAVEVADDHRP